jgi:hypothetical protein
VSISVAAAAADADPRKRRLLLCAALCAALWLPALAWAGPGLLLGIDDDLGKWNGNSPVAGAIADLGGPFSASP